MKRGSLWLFGSRKGKNVTEVCEEVVKANAQTFSLE